MNRPVHSGGLVLFQNTLCEERMYSVADLKKGLKIIEFPTIESNRIDDRIGSPSISTGIAFQKLYFKELFNR